MGKKKDYKAFPVFVSMVDKKCVIYGGGTIATRRAAGLLRYGALVDVFSPVISDSLREMAAMYPEQLSLHYEVYKPGIPEADYVLSCVNDRNADDAIYLECRERGIPVSVASDRDKCDFYFPALVEGDDVVIGITSRGLNHGNVRRVASELRDWIRVVDQAGGA